MKINTKFGTLYIETDPQERDCLAVLDSQKHTLFNGCNEAYIEMMKEQIEKAKTIDEWLSNYDDVCWDTNKNKLIAFIRYYVKHNMIHDEQIVFDKEWFNDHYNKIGNTYVMFEYSDCWKVKGI
jgi:hypothetical protein